MGAKVMSFTYQEFTTRNFGFINQAEQEKLRDAHVFIPGVGGMGGACIQSLARSGIGNFTIADMDVFEVSNLNRQVFANLDTVDIEKSRATEMALKRINPEINLRVFDGNWPAQTEEILKEVDIVVNGMDDVRETAKLYRACRRHKLPMVDAYAASLPSVYVTRPNDQTPEERLDYPTKNLEPEAWSEEILDGVFIKELEYVMACSSSRKYIDMQAGAEMAAGTRSRMSFAPMVILTGNLMAYEAVNHILGRKSGADNRGYFFNPHTGRTEKPPFRLAEKAMRAIAGRMIRKLLEDA